MESEPSTILSPLQNLLRKDAPWTWSDREEQAFQRIKRELASDRVLTHFDPEARLTLCVDASPTGLGAYLAQGEEGHERPLAFASRSLSATERNYSQINKEAAAIIFGVKHFHQYLYGREIPFILKTDHRPLLAIFGKKNGVPVMTASRLQRYAIFLSAYNYDIQYIAGDRNSVADYFSRMPVSDSFVEPEECAGRSLINFIVNETLPISFHDIKKATASDATLKTVIKYLLIGWPKKVKCKNILPYFNCKNDLEIDNGCLMRGHRIIIPQVYRTRMIHELHKGHLGVVKTKSLARTKMWWPGIDGDIQRSVLACSTCSALGPAPPAAPPAPWPRDPAPWARLHIDYMQFAQRFYLIVVDSHSKWVECLYMCNLSTKSLIQRLKLLFYTFGIPHVIVSDNDPKISNEEFTYFCLSNGIRHITSPIYHPCSNGQAENSVKTCKKMLKCIFETNMNASVEQVNEKLSSYLFEFRNSVHCSTGESPAKLMFGRELRGKLDLIMPPQKQTIVPNVDKADCRQFDIGQKVLARYFVSGKPNWTLGKIINKLGSRMYVVEINDIECRRHADQLRLYHEPIASSESLVPSATAPQVQPRNVTSLSPASVNREMDLETSGPPTAQPNLDNEPSVDEFHECDSEVVAGPSLESPATPAGAPVAVRGEDARPPHSQLTTAVTDNVTAETTTIKDYIEVTKDLRQTSNNNLLLTFKRPHKAATAQSISRWIKQVLSESGVDVSVYSGHSTRHASTSAASSSGLSVEAIRKAAGWTKNSETFAKFYRRQVWIKQVLSESGVDVSVYSGHSTRHASTSAASSSGLSVEAIRKAAGWTKNSETFAKFYHRQVYFLSCVSVESVPSVNRDPSILYDATWISSTETKEHVSSKLKDPDSLQKTYSGLLANITEINSVLKDLLRNYGEIKKIKGQELSAESFEDKQNINAEKDYESGEENGFKILFGNPGTGDDVARTMDDMEDMHLENDDSSIEDKPKPKRGNVKRNTHQEKKKKESIEEEEEETAKLASNEALTKRVTVGIMVRRRVDAKDSEKKKTVEEETLGYKILKKKLQKLAAIEQIVKESDAVTETPLEADSGNHRDILRQQGKREEKDRDIHKSLRTEEDGGIACLKIDVKKCYMALTAALAKYCSGKYNCNDGFKDKFKGSSRVHCIQIFQADLVGNSQEDVEAPETNDSEGVEAPETNDSEAPSRKKEGWVTKKPNYIRKVNKLSSEQIKDHNKKHEKVNDQHVKNAVQEVFLDDLLNIIQMDAKRTILNKRALKNIETQPIIVESLYKLRNADTNIEPRLVEEVTKYKMIPLQTKRNKLLETLLRTAPVNKEVKILRESNLQNLEKECANIKTAKCSDACEKSMLENGITDAAQKEKLYDHCKTQCSHIFAFSCGGKSGKDESDDSDNSESDGSNKSESDDYDSESDDYDSESDDYDNESDSGSAGSDK
ncbi:unnamed protein product [Plutella xylostella]|uniref:RNA-directed DNA polymerase n=1 Tax=Plutella xylostella TaxID=51655 RepID=A0A8S4ELA8_PLUXY|nr:unnamed protein product [Plutella xylostella]